jgi:hypothetical protein
MPVKSVNCPFRVIFYLAPLMFKVITVAMVKSPGFKEKLFPENLTF